MKKANVTLLISALALSAPALVGCAVDLEIDEGAGGEVRSGEADRVLGDALASGGHPGGALGPAAVESQAELSRMKAYLAGRYDAADVVHSFAQPSGDIIDCVPRDAQPSMLAASARGRAIATPPPLSPSGAGAPASGDGMEAFLVAGQRDAKGVERSCPADAVPLRRIALEELARFRTLDDWMRRLPTDGQGAASQRLGSSALHQHATATQSGLPNQGAHTRINVWNPYVEVGSEFSSSRLLVERGSDASLQSLFAGAHTFPNRYGDWQPRLFIYSTSDGYPGTTGCYNLDCGRFVQVDGRVVLGGTLAASVPGGTQYELEVSFLRWNGDWWLGVNGIWVGYYPGSLFHGAGLAYGADRLELGGEILDDRTAHPGRHTMTDMGSGVFPAGWYRHAAYQRDMWYWADPSRSYYLTGLSTYRTDASCYDVSFHVSSDPTWRTFLFMGGSGYSASCL